jgi:prepilin-type N-terminal cleavage/methylation domain-containing protein
MKDGANTGPFSLSGRTQAFTLVEVLAAVAVSALLLFALSNLLGSSLQTMSRTTRSLQAHDGTTQLLEYLRADLRDLAPPSAALPEPFHLTSKEDEVVLAVVRPDPRFLGLPRQGYHRHVEYRWDRESRTLLRAVYHAAEHPTAQNLAAASDSSDHTANAQRLGALTPALASATKQGWRQSEEMEEARRVATEAPFLAEVEEFSVECLTGEPLSTLGDSWSESSALPAAVRVRVGFRSSAGQGELRHFSILIPVQSALPSKP